MLDQNTEMTSASQILGSSWHFWETLDVVLQGFTLLLLATL
jgi:hypothetical protein